MFIIDMFVISIILSRGESVVGFVKENNKTHPISFLLFVHLCYHRHDSFLLSDASVDANAWALVGNEGQF